MSIDLMSLILEQWLNLKAPLNRISQYLSRQGIKYTRQQLYSYTDTTAVMLMPVFKYMELYIGEAKLIGVDETHRSCREKQRLKDRKQNKISVGQRTLLTPTQRIPHSTTTPQ